MYSAGQSALLDDTDIVQSGVPDSSIAISSGLNNNNPTAGTPLLATVSFAQGDGAATPITYTWFADGNQVQSGSYSFYTPTEATVGSTITVEASFTDLFGNAILDNSSATGAVLDAPPTVTVPIITLIGQTFTASATTAPEDDTLTFEWFSAADNFTNPIAAGSTYTVTSGAPFPVQVVAIATNANGVEATASGSIPRPIIEILNPPHVANSNVDEWVLSKGQWALSIEPGSIPSGYQIVGTGDFTLTPNGGTYNGGVLLQNPNTGDTQEWLIDASWLGTVDLGGHPGNFQIAGIGDFFGDGIDDVLWTSNSGGQVQTDVWDLNSSGQWQASVSPGSHPAGYDVVGVGDFTGDGTSDILWQNPTTGDVDEWQIADGQWVKSVDLGSHPGAGWTIAGVGDFFGNGIDDILWTNPNGPNGNTQVDIWELGSNGQWINSVSPGSHPAGYQVAAIGDFTGNGIDGVLWYDLTNGNVDEWVLNGNGQWAASIDLGTHPGDFQITGTGSFTPEIPGWSNTILWHSSS